MLKLIISGVFLCIAQASHAQSIHCPDINLRTLSERPALTGALRAGKIPTAYLDAEKIKKAKKLKQSQDLKKDQKKVSADILEDDIASVSVDIESSLKNKALFEFCKDLTDSTIFPVATRSRSYRAGDPL